MLHKTVDRKVCYSGLSNSCEKEFNIKVRNCGNYRTYYLIQLNVDKSAYCFGKLNTYEHDECIVQTVAKGRICIWINKQIVSATVGWYN